MSVGGPSLRHALPALYAASAVRLLLPLVILPLMAVRLGADAFGRLGFILVWSAVLSTLVEGGFVAAATRLAVTAGAAGRQVIAQQVLSARTALMLPATLAAFAVARWVAPDRSHVAEDALSIGLLACAFGSPATWYLQATQQLHRWARVEGVVYAALVATLALWGHSVVAFVALQFLASATLAVLGWRWLARDLARAGERKPLWSAAAVRPGLAMGGRMLPVSLAGAAYSVALPAVASAHLPRADLGLYVLADRIVRAVLAAADPVYSLVYPRIVALHGESGRAALRHAARWAAAGVLTGGVLYVLVVVGWSAWTPWVFGPAADAGTPGGAIDLPRLASVFAVLAALWPLVFGWRFFGYWLLGSGRHDHAYRVSMIVAGIVGVIGAATVGGHGAVALAGVAVAVEAVVLVIGAIGMVWGARDNR